MLRSAPRARAAGSQCRTSLVTADDKLMSGNFEGKYGAYGA